MESDVKIGLLFAAAIAVACGSTRISFNAGETPSEKSAPSIAAVKQADPVISIPAPSAVAPVEKLVKSEAPADKKKEAEDALAKLFPKDLRKKADETAQKAAAAKDDLSLEFDDPLAIADEKKKSPPKSEPAKPTSAPVEKEKTASPTSKANSPEKLDMPKFEDDLLADISGVQDSDDGGMTNDSSSPSSSGSNSPKRLPDPDPDPDPIQPAKSGKGPVHPYFERFLESGNYFVREGDSLKDIAYNLYQDESRADEILKLNKSLMKKASDIRPGMRLKLPR